MTSEPSWWSRLPTDPDERAAILSVLSQPITPPRLRYCPRHITVTPKQEVFLGLNGLEAFYGGAAGGGKSVALLLAALQYVDVPGYAALILRRTYPDLALPGALMDMANQWLSPTDARWIASERAWRFPSGAKLAFGYLEHEEQKRRYASAEFHFVAFDELTTFSETAYTFLFSRLRRPAFSRTGRAADGVGIADVPLRMRTASNPGGSGHDWVRRRLVDAETREPGAVFVPARLSENPYLDRDAYVLSLAHLTIIERERLLDGDWDAVEDGGMFQPDAWPVLQKPPGWNQRVRVWDLAGSEPTPSNSDPDWTVGLLLERDAASGQCCVSHVERFRRAPAETEERIAATADRDGRETPVVIEQEPGSAGVALISRYSRHVLRGKTSVHAVRPTGDKVTRARPVSAAAGRGEVSIVMGAWAVEFVAELRRFPMVKHDDQADALAHAYNMVGSVSGRGVATVARGRLPETIRN